MTSDTQPKASNLTDLELDILAQLIAQQQAFKIIMNGIAARDPLMVQSILREANTKVADAIERQKTLSGQAAKMDVAKYLEAIFKASKKS